MAEYDTTISDDRFDDPVPGAPEPRKRYPKWPFILAGLLMFIGVGIAIAWPIKVPFYTLSPGPVYDSSNFVEVPDATGEADGEIFFLTVSLKEANVFEYLAGLVNPSVSISPRENIRPTGVSPLDLRRENLAGMEQSKLDAKFVALTTLGYEPTYIGTGALTIETVPDSAADGVLLANDVIIEMDGRPIAFRDDVLAAMADKEIGDVVIVVVERTGDDGTIAVLELTLVLGPHVDDPDLPMIGVLLDNSPPIVEFPVKVRIDSQNIGGPSAGAMFTLQIINELTDEDITGGRRIAGTGTIRRDGTVGPIGGVRQKVFGAIDAGAIVVFVPADNFDDAVEAAGDRIHVVALTTIDDALDYLRAN